MTPKKLFWIHEHTGDMEAALKFIRDYGIPSHAHLDKNDEGEQCIPAVISYGDVPEDTLPLGCFLVVKEDRNTYAYTKAEKEAGLKPWEE